MTEIANKEAKLQKEIEQLRSELAAAQLSKDVRTAELLNSEERFALAMRGASAVCGIGI